MSLVDHPPVGMDVGVAKSMAFSDRTEVQLPVMDQDEEKALARLHRIRKVTKQRLVRQISWTFFPGIYLTHFWAVR